MRILAEIHSHDDPVALALEAVQRQTRRVDGIVVIDDGSDRPDALGPLPEGVPTIRCERNLGVGGALEQAFRYALENGYDWVWVLDSDSGPRPDALEKLIALFESFAPSARARIGVVACTPVLAPANYRLLGRRLTPGGMRNPAVAAASDWYECDAVIWSGSLCRLEAVRAVGWPRHGQKGPWEDLAMDYGDHEYCGRMRQAGYRVVVHCEAVLEHHVGSARMVDLPGVFSLSTNHSPARRYLLFRNLVYYWLYLYPSRNWLSLGAWFGARLAITIAKILAYEDDRRAKIRACLRGTWDGFRKRIDRPYSA